MSLAANMLDMDRNNVFDVVVKSHRTNYDNCRVVDMAFWFGITSLIRPISMERIPTIRILASTKQRCAATSHHQLQTPESLQTFHRHQHLRVQKLQALSTILCREISTCSWNVVTTAPMLQSPEPSRERTELEHLLYHRYGL
jgi:hypothetical protein